MQHHYPFDHRCRGSTAGQGLRLLKPPASTGGLALALLPSLGQPDTPNSLTCSRRSARHGAPSTPTVALATSWPMPPPCLAPCPPPCRA